MKTYSGIITELPENGVFVYGANTEGRHGLGAAKVARQRFGAKYGEVGFNGKSYGIITKDLRVKAHPSVSKESIIDSIGRLYIFARYMRHLEFWVAYSGEGKNLNYYTPSDMAKMFASHEIPKNMVFEEKFWRLINDK